MLRIPRRIVRFEAAIALEFWAQLRRIVFKNAVCHESTLNWLLIAETFKSECNVADGVCRVGRG